MEQMLIVDWTRWKAHLQPAGLGCFRTGFFVFGSRIRRGIWAKLRQGRALFGKIALGSPLRGAWGGPEPSAAGIQLLADFCARR